MRGTVAHGVPQVKDAVSHRGQPRHDYPAHPLSDLYLDVGIRRMDCSDRTRSSQRENGTRRRQCSCEQRDVLEALDWCVHLEWAA